MRRTGRSGSIACRKIRGVIRINTSTRASTATSMSTASAPTARRAAKAKLPTSATGIPERRDCGAPTVSAVSTARLAKPALAGFSLIELLVVVAIIGIVALVATLSINGSSEHQLQREAERFEALIA